MPKRKSSGPVKFNNSFENFVFHTSSSSSPSQGKRVSFELSDAETSGLSDTSFRSKPLKRRKVLREVPQKCVVLGDISFMVEVNENTSYSDCAHISLLIHEDNDKFDLVLEIKSADGEKKCLKIEHPDDFPWTAIWSLLTKNFTWIIKDVAELSKGFVNMSVGISPEKTPVAQAKNIAELFIQKSLPNYDSDSRQCVDSIENFFVEMERFQRENLELLDVDIQHKSLKPTLCPYQGRAVQWMLTRESADLHCQTSDWKNSLIETISSINGTPVYYNLYSQVLFLDMIEFPPFPRGGILADEMGLGKTVTVIALILNNPRNAELEMDTDECILPLAGSHKVTYYAGKKESDDEDADFELKKKNNEKYLTLHEQLVRQDGRGKSLRAALTKWYESSLAEWSAVTPTKRQRTSRNGVKCVCGDSTMRKACVKCPECERLQHAACVGYDKKYRYFCPMCWTKQKLVKSNATLIVSPPSIYHQWHEEIKKHVDVSDAFPGGVFMYDDGLKTGFVQPSVLASYDVVISTYSRLRSELNHANVTESSRKLRNEERFLRQCSPLTQIEWWRLCLDEAQMVETESSVINQMAKLIPSVNRWSVTGTPVQKSINDLFHLLDFLRVEPFTDKTLWSSLLYSPYVHGNKTPMCSTVGHIFWRNSKESVSDELVIPEQKTSYHFLKFTAIEQNFYMREHTTSSCEFAEGVLRSRLDGKTTIDDLDKHVLTKLLRPLLNIRQACSHPLAVKGNKITTKSGSMTMTELFQYLYNKTKVECEEELRKYISSLNGMAGIFCIKEDWPNAVEYYRRVLQIAEEYNGKVDVDSLQRIHTLTNLAEVLQFHGDGIPPTLRDDTLKDNAKRLEDKYMKKALDDLKSDQTAAEEFSSKVSDLEKKFTTESEVWWLRIIHTLTLDDGIDELTNKISLEVMENRMESKKSMELFLSKLSTPRGIEVVLRNWLRSVEENRKEVMDRLETLSKTPWDELVYQAVNCHLRTLTSAMKPKKCELCNCENLLLDYECCLFAVSRKVLKEEYEKVLDGTKTKGSWKAHNGEIILRAMLSVGRTKSGTESWALRDGRNHINMLDTMKKEFKQLRVVWMSLNHLIQARDEVSMCKERLRLRFPGEPLPPKPTKLNLKEENKIETIYIIEKHEVEGQRLKLTGEIEVSKSEFKKKYGTLLYLDNLGKKENAKPDPCPICNTSLENEWCVLQCGHSFCIECVRILLMRTVKPSVSCAVCREVTKCSDLSFVDLSGREENSDVKVVGEHSTKVEAIVRTLLELRKEDPSVKVLIFSTWAVVLKVLAVALTENDISFRRMPGYNYQVHLKEFKDPNMRITALLLPISWGSKGLNLIEATHVFLVEPIMNPAEELQALGRVHRIGQTKETVVHRFLMRGTIEEKIHAAVSEAKDKWDKRKVTLDDLRNLFDIKCNLVVGSDLTSQPEEP